MYRSINPSHAVVIPVPVSENLFEKRVYAHTHCLSILYGCLTFKRRILASYLKILAYFCYLLPHDPSLPERRNTIDGTDKRSFALRIDYAAIILLKSRQREISGDVSYEFVFLSSKAFPGIP